MVAMDFAVCRQVKRARLGIRASLEDRRLQAIVATRGLRKSLLSIFDLHPLSLGFSGESRAPSLQLESSRPSGPTEFAVCPRTNTIP